MAEFALKKPGLTPTDFLLLVFGVAWLVIAPSLVNLIGLLVIGIAILLTYRRISIPYLKIIISVDSVGLASKNGAYREIPVKDLVDLVRKRSVNLY